jgi:hypothetical protein
MLALSLSHSHHSAARRTSAHRDGANITSMLEEEHGADQLACVHLLVHHGALTEHVLCTCLRSLVVGLTLVAQALWHKRH